MFVIRASRSRISVDLRGGHPKYQYRVVTIASYSALNQSKEGLGDTIAAVELSAAIDASLRVELLSAISI